MEDHSKHIDDLFREELGDYKEAPGAAVWDSLDQRLPAEEASPAKEGSGRKWLWYLLLLALLGTVGYFIVRKLSESATTQPSKEIRQTEAPATSSAGNSGENRMLPAPSMDNNGPATGRPLNNSETNTAASTGNKKKASSADNTAFPKGATGENKASHTKAASRAAANSNSRSSVAVGNATSRTRKKTSSPDNGSAKTVKDRRAASGQLTDNKSAAKQSRTVPLVNVSRNNNKNTTNNTTSRENLNEKKAVPQITNKNVATAGGTHFAAAEASDVTVRMGKKARTEQPANTVATEPAKKTFEVSKQGVRILAEDEEELKLAAEEEVNKITEAVEKSEEKESVQTEEQQEATPPVLATGSGAGGGGGEKEPHVPLRNFAPKLQLEGGIKAGYEKTTGKLPVSSAVFSPYLQWNISPKVALVLMPSFRYNSISRNIFDGTKAYHNITSATLDSVHVFSQDSFGNVSIRRNYFYNNVYDSILISTALKNKSYWEVDLPLLLKFNLGSGFSVNGGLYLTYGNLIRIDQATTKIAGLQKSDTLAFSPVPENSSAPQIPTANNYFPYNTPDIATAPSANAVNPATNPARFGYMLGVTYNISSRFMVDVLVRQNVSDMRYIPNEQIRKTYTQPAVRLTVGVKLFESGNKSKPINPNGL